MCTIARIHLYKDDPKRSWADDGQTAKNGGFVCLVQGEGGAEQLEFHLMLDFQTPLDLTGRTVTFYLTKPDGRQIYLPAGIPSGGAALGIAVTALTAQCTALSGIAKHGEVRVTESGGGVIKFPTPDFYISASETENAVESTSEFQALDLELIKAESALSDSQSALASAQEVLNGDRQAVSEASAVASELGQNAETAGTAAANATDAAAANAAATSASSAAQAANSAASGIPSAVTAQIDAQKGAAGGIAPYDALQGHLLDHNNPHAVTALQIGVCNPNLLTDGDFQVWQEAESFTGLTGNRYTATMWQAWESTGATYDVQKAGDFGGVVVTNRSSSAIEIGLVTLVEKGTVKPNAAYTVTLRGAPNGSALTFYVADYGKAAFAGKTLTESDCSFTFTTPASLENCFYVAVSISNLAAGAQAEIDGVKLEEGGGFTGFYAEQYADVFARTLRYYQRSFDDRSLTLSTGAGTASLFIPLYCPMRIAPSVSVIQGASTQGCIGVNWKPDVTPTNLRCIDARPGGFILAFDNAAANTQYLLKTDIIQADART